jgi:hypothetical protein
MNMQDLLKYASLIFCLMLLSFAAVQYNDPDWPVWIYAYLVPAYISLCAFRNKFNRELIAVVALAALLGAVTFFPFGHYEGVALKDGMKTMEIELARESLGLAIVFVAMLTHLFQAYTSK